MEEAIDAGRSRDHRHRQLAGPRQWNPRGLQVMSGTGVTRDTVVERVFRELRAFRIYDGPTEVHRWSLAKQIKRHALERKQP